MKNHKIEELQSTALLGRPCPKKYVPNIVIRRIFRIIAVGFNKVILILSIIKISGLSCGFLKH